MIALPDKVLLKRRMASIYPTAPNTVRLFCPEGSNQGVVHVQGRIMEEILGLARQDIFCVQACPRRGLFVFSFHMIDAVWTCYVSSKELADHHDLKDYRFFIAQQKRRVPVMVQMYNPFVWDEEIMAFLSRYCNYVSPGQK